MNVLHLIDTTGPGGAETIFTELAHSWDQQAKGQSLALIRGDGWVSRRLDQLGVETITENCKGSFNFSFLAKLCSIIHRRKINLIHSHLLGSNVYASLAGLLTHTRVISTFHGVVDIAENERLARVKMALIRHGSTVVTVSEDLRSEVATRLRLPTDRVFLIPNAIDCQTFAEARRRHLAAAEPRPTIVIGALGNIRPAKSYDVALRAIAKLRARGKQLRFRIAGDPKEPLQNELRKLSEQLALDDCVEFIGFVDDPAKFLAELDIFLLSSSSEGHPLALTQAMAAGLPIVATKCGVEKILGDDMAWLAEPGNPEALAAALSAAIDHPNMQLAERAQAEATSKYDYKIMCNRYAALYAHAQ